MIFADGFLTCLTTSGVLTHAVVPDWHAVSTPAIVLGALVAVGGATLCGLRRVMAYNAIPTSEERR